MGVTMRCPRLAVAMFFSVVLAVLAAPMTPAGAGSIENDRAQFVGYLNQLRVSQGLAPLQVDPELTALAQQWAEHVAVVKQMVHPDDPRVGVTSPWLRLGENVAFGSTTEITWQGLLDSPAHYTNMVDPGFTHVGIGIAYADGVQYINQRFMEIGPPPLPQAPPDTEPPPPPPPPEPPPPPVEPPSQVLGAVVARDVNLAVIPPIRYGGAVGNPSPVPTTTNGLPILAIVATVVALLAVGAAGWAWHARRTSPT